MYSTSTMLKGFCLTIACLIGTSVSFAGNVNFVVGQRSLDEDDWAPVEDQDLIGVNVSFGAESWPISLVAGFHRSEDDQAFFDPFFGPVSLDVETTELSFGVMKIWDQYPTTRPFIGGGLSLIEADVEGTVFGFTASDDDNSEAFYINGGVFWRIGERFNIGVDVRLLFGSDIDIAGVSADVDYEQFGLILGWGW